MRKVVFEWVQRRTSVIFPALLLMALCGAHYFPYLGSIPFFDKGEPREALAVQDIVQRGEWLVPLKRATDVPSKPPLFHWSAALVTLVTGSFTEATIRLPSALYATLGVLLIYWLGRKIFDPRTALLGSAILATMMIYQDQALSARVDMTLCFFVTLSLVNFFVLYRGYLKHPVWFYIFYAVLGIGTLAKGPLGVLLPALVAGSFALIERRWDLIRKFCFHPGVLLTILLGAGWYVIAVTRGGEGFFDRQILQENLSRFVGGSGHNHPVYYYIPYLFLHTLPWSLFLPVVLWDLFKRGSYENSDVVYLKLWFLVVLIFFSISAGKRPVYLLPAYPALSLLLANWFCTAASPGKGRLAIYRAISTLAAGIGFLLLVITLGALWNHDPGWFFAPIEGLLRAKDRANVVAVRNQLEHFGWTFTLLLLAAALLWLSLGRLMWQGKMRGASLCLVIIALIQGTVGWSLVMPVIAERKSYQAFMAEVNRRVKPEDKLYTYGRFNSSPVVFYHGRVIERLAQPIGSMASKGGGGDTYIIMPARLSAAENLPPLIKSEGTGPEGDAPLVLVQVDLP